MNINNNEISRIMNIITAIAEGYYNDLAKVNYINTGSINKLELHVKPYEGIHSNIPYHLIIKFINNDWPRIFVNSLIFDKIKTNQYLNNQEIHGEHKGICIKNFSYGYAFRKNFKKYCANKWKNYIYYIITIFNNIQDFEKGNGFKSNYKKILNISS